MKRKKLILERVELISKTNLKTFKGGKFSPSEDPVTLITWTFPDAHQDGDDGIKND